MQTNSIVGIAAIAFCAYGAISFLLDLRRGILWIVRGVAECIARTLATMLRSWRSWVADRERRRRQDNHQMIAMLVSSNKAHTDMLEQCLLQIAALEAKRDEALVKPPAPAPAAPRRN